VVKIIDRPPNTIIDGNRAGEKNDLQPNYPIDLAGSLKAPVLGLCGEADQGIPVESVEKMRAARKDAGKTREIVLYPDTPHAFFADYRPGYRKDKAEDGWKRMLEWFRKYGVA
jgi:carboxymethylenebutenolidase